MLENLKSLVQQYAGDAIINNPAIPNERNDEAVEETSQSIFDGLKNAVSQGNLSEVTNMFNGGEQSVTQSAVAQDIQGGLIGNLMKKFGLDQEKAGGIASMIIPIVLKKFVNKTNDPNDSSFNLQDILGKLTSGGLGGKDVLPNSGGETNEGGLMDKLKGLFN